MKIVIQPHTALPKPTEAKIQEKEGVPLCWEGSQWTGSVKYRLVYQKLLAGVDSGEITPQTTLTEVTSGSTGIALAFAGKKVDLPVIIHAYQNTPPEKLKKIRDLDADLVMHSANTPMDRILSYLQTRKSDAHSFWHLNQYDRNSFFTAYKEFGEELCDQWLQEMKSPPDNFLCPVGTGGLIQGVGKVLRETFPQIKIIALEPEKGASIDGMRNTQEMHLGKQDPYDKNFPDERREVPPPAERVSLENHFLGWSGSAAWIHAHLHGMENSLVLSPD